jgi:hypothetical protein
VGNIQTSVNIVLPFSAPQVCCTPCNIPKHDLKLDIFSSGILHTDKSYYPANESITVSYDNNNSWWLSSILISDVTTPVYRHIFDESNPYFCNIKKYRNYSIKCEPTSHNLTLRITESYVTSSNVPPYAELAISDPSSASFIYFGSGFFSPPCLAPTLLNNYSPIIFIPGTTHQNAIVRQNGAGFEIVIAPYDITTSVNCNPYVAIWNLQEPEYTFFTFGGFTTIYPPAQLVYTITDPQ